MDRGVACNRAAIHLLPRQIQHALQPSAAAGADHRHLPDPADAPVAARVLPPARKRCPTVSMLGQHARQAAGRPAAQCRAGIRWALLPCTGVHGQQTWLVHGLATFGDCSKFQMR